MFFLHNSKIRVYSSIRDNENIYDNTDSGKKKEEKKAVQLKKKTPFLNLDMDIQFRKSAIIPEIYSSRKQAEYKKSEYFKTLCL